MRKLAITALITATIAAAPVASVMAAPQAPAGAQEQQQPIKVSDSQLKEFADAQKQLTGIRDDAMAKLNKSKDPKEAQKIQMQANQDMVSAVKKSGLSVKDYNSIARAMQNQPDLRARLKKMQ
ncbi:DUF4168 domain-containing protein [Gallaecimonas mangrovi]|uniref:DUF4168 domain-containing protein n=1 Tax=Gallaecimonas mangrovi TaxID=2291597 RepID=UPI001868EA25|nr:DUF4168 domain-containing protein [Gallaecimonas mangrovi]